MYQLKIFEQNREVLTIAALKHQIFHDRLAGKPELFRFINIRGLILQLSADDVRRMIRMNYCPCEVSFYENEDIIFQEQCVITILQPVSPARWQLGFSVIFKARMFETIPVPQ